MHVWPLSVRVHSTKLELEFVEFSGGVICDGGRGCDSLFPKEGP